MDIADPASGLRKSRSKKAVSGPPRVYIVGGGIASLAAAALMIRDGNVFGRTITIFEAADRVGGSLAAAGSPLDGYGASRDRMFDGTCCCTLDLFSSIPTLDESGTVTQEILRWNDTLEPSFKVHVVREGRRQTAPKFGLSDRDILTIERMTGEPEALLEGTSIAEQVDADFFRTDFWFMWRALFAFQPWHSAVEFRRSLTRFSHLVAGFDCLQGVLQLVYNQCDSLVRPLHRWLKDRGVRFSLNTRVTDLDFRAQLDKNTVERIVYEQDGTVGQIAVSPGDYVFVTLGSSTEGSSLGKNGAAPVVSAKQDGSAWTLWENLAVARPEFGRPSAFAGNIEQSKWVSFTITLHDPTFSYLVRDVTDIALGDGGLITFPDSGWQASMCVPHQPQFIGQPKHLSVFWGYGLSIDEPGDFIKKPMSACSGREIMTEILGYLGIGPENGNILDSCTCTPCFSPFISSQLLRREEGDRPQVLPRGVQNLAFMGQFSEMPDEAVSTVEYSIRSAQVAVYGLLELDRKVPAVRRGDANRHRQLGY